MKGEHYNRYRWNSEVYFQKIIKYQKEMGKFLDTHDLPKLNQQDVNEN